MEGHAVGALIHGGVALVGAHQDPIQGAVVLAAAVVAALMHGALDGLIGMTIHKVSLLFSDSRLFCSGGGILCALIFLANCDML